MEETALQFYNTFAEENWLDKLDKYDPLVIKWNQDFRDWLIWKLAYTQDVLKYGYWDEWIWS